MKLFKRDTISKQELQVGKGFAKVLNKIGNDVVKLSCTLSILLSVVTGTKSANCMDRNANNNKINAATVFTIQKHILSKQ